MLAPGDAHEAFRPLSPSVFVATPSCTIVVGKCTYPSLDPIPMSNPKVTGTKGRKIKESVSKYW